MFNSQINYRNSETETILKAGDQLKQMEILTYTESSKVTG